MAWWKEARERRRLRLKTCQASSSNYSGRTFPDYKQRISGNNRPSWKMGKTNGRLLCDINLSLKMLCFSLFCIFLSLCCRGNWILPSGTAAASDWVLQSGGSYLSLSTRCCSSPSRNKLGSTKGKEVCGRTRTHTHTNTL